MRFFAICHLVFGLAAAIATKNAIPSKTVANDKTTMTTSRKGRALSSRTTTPAVEVPTVRVHGFPVRVDEVESYMSQHPYESKIGVAQGSGRRRVANSSRAVKTAEPLRA